jgi:hypothetical protein
MARLQLLSTPNQDIFIADTKSKVTSAPIYSASPQHDIFWRLASCAQETKPVRSYGGRKPSTGSDRCGKPHWLSPREAGRPAATASRGVGGGGSRGLRAVRHARNSTLTRNNISSNVNGAPGGPPLGGRRVAPEWWSRPAEGYNDRPRPAHGRRLGRWIDRAGRTLSIRPLPDH